MLVSSTTLQQKKTSNVVVTPLDNTSGVWNSFTPPKQCPVSITEIVKKILPDIEELKEEPDISFVSDTLKSFIQLPPSVEILDIVTDAGAIGKKLNENIDKAKQNGKSDAEAYVCETTKILTTELSGQAMKGAITGGIPPYVASVVTNPELLPTVPTVTKLLPKAYQGADTTAKVIGNSVGIACYGGFSLAKKLSQKK